MGNGVHTKQFHKDSVLRSQDQRHYEKLQKNIDQYKSKVPQGRSQFANYEQMRILLHHKKKRSIGQLEKLLVNFEIQFTQKGGTVLWADNVKEAVAHVVRLCRYYDANMVVKSKSMVSEEIHLNEYLTSFGIEPVETDLGEFIQQLCGELPYHILTPAIHKSKEDVAALFHKRFKVPPNLPPSEITRIARYILREKFLKAKVGITGGNFLVAETGSVLVTENEGNARMATSLPEAHIAIVGIEKVIEKVEDLSLFLPMLATSGTGQRLTSYNTLFSGAKGEGGNPKNMYVILLNNGRTNLLKDVEMYESLFCIRCGACLNACPVYKTIGGHAYGSTYSGPIGSVISPHLDSLASYGHLNFASSLCGACTEVCPVKIPIHRQLLANRSKYAANKQIRNTFFWKMWKTLMLHRWLLDIIPSRIKNMMAKTYVANNVQHKEDKSRINLFARTSAHTLIMQIIKRRSR